MSVAKRAWLPEEIQLLKSEYATNSLDELCKVIGRHSRRAIRQKAYTLNLRKHPWKYEVNHNFFEEWNEEMAYILGFFCADGCLKDRNRINFSNCEYEIIRLIKLALQAENPIYEFNRENRKTLYVLEFTSKKIKEKLEEIGLTEKKSSTLKFPKVPIDYLKDFIRGFFDGDGGLHISKRNNQLIIYFASGSEAFIKSLEKKLRCKLKLREKKINFRGGVYRLRYYSNEAKTILSWLYEGASLFMKSKYEKFMVLSDIRRNKGG